MAAPKRRWRPRAALAAGAVIAGGAAFALGPAAPWIIDHVADGQRIWRLGTLHVDGVHGSWLGALRAGHVSIADAEGVWFEANDVALEWRPLDILSGALSIDSAHARAVLIRRQPALSTPQPAASGDIDVRIGALRVDTIDIAQQAVGEAARFTADLSLDLRGDTLNSAEVALRRTDSDADHVLVRYRAGPHVLLSADIRGEAGGILSRAIGAPDKALLATASGGGDSQNDEQHFRATLGGGELASGQARWTPDHWSATAQARIEALPRYGELARRIVFLVNGRLGFAFHLMPHLKEVAKLMEIIRHPQGHVARGPVAGHEA